MNRENILKNEKPKVQINTKASRPLTKVFHSWPLRDKRRYEWRAGNTARLNDAVGTFNDARVTRHTSICSIDNWKSMPTFDNMKWFYFIAFLLTSDWIALYYRFGGKGILWRTFRGYNFICLIPIYVLFSHVSI